MDNQEAEELRKKTESRVRNEIGPEVTEKEVLFMGTRLIQVSGFSTGFHHLYGLEEGKRVYVGMVNLPLREFHSPHLKFPFVYLTREYAELTETGEIKLTPYQQKRKDGGFPPRKSTKRQ